jgi:penicillin-binding protein 2
MIPLSRRPRPVKDANVEGDLFRRRAAAGFVLVALVLCVLLGRYLQLQVLAARGFPHALRGQPDQVAAAAAEPWPDLRPQRAAARGERAAIPARAGAAAGGNVERTLAALAEVVNLSDDDIARFKESRAMKRAFDSVPLKLLLSESELANFAVQRYRFPGVEVVPT